MFFSKKNKIVAPVDGQFIPLEEVQDPVFAKGIMGGGVAVFPSEKDITSPVDGTVSMVAEQKHGIGIIMNDGTEILIHMGIDTVELRGAPFEIKKKIGDVVKQGELLAYMDIEMIKNMDKDPVVMIITTGKQLNKVNYKTKTAVRRMEELAKIS